MAAAAVMLSPASPARKRNRMMTVTTTGAGVNDDAGDSDLVFDPDTPATPKAGHATASAAASPSPLVFATPSPKKRVKPTPPASGTGYSAAAASAAAAVASGGVSVTGSGGGGKRSSKKVLHFDANSAVAANAAMNTAAASTTASVSGSAVDSKSAIGSLLLPVPPPLSPNARGGAVAAAAASALRSPSKPRRSSSSGGSGSEPPSPTRATRSQTRTDNPLATDLGADGSVKVPYDFDEDACFAVPKSQWSTAYQEKEEKIGTLDNKSVHVCVSDLAASSGIVMFGLFAGRDFAAGEVVTTYGGSLRHASTARNEPALMHTHTRRIPDSEFVRDGLKWSQQFVHGASIPAILVRRDTAPTNTAAAAATATAASAGASTPTRTTGNVLASPRKSVRASPAKSPRRFDPSSPARATAAAEAAATAPVLVPVTLTAAQTAEYAQLKSQFMAEMDLPASERTRVQPIGVPQLVPDPIERAALIRKIRSTGIGYMANTGTQAQWNVSVVDVAPRKDKMGPRELFYIATRHIRANEEILSPYHWAKKELLDTAGPAH